MIDQRLRITQSLSRECFSGTCGRPLHGFPFVGRCSVVATLPEMCVSAWVITSVHPGQFHVPSGSICSCSAGKVLFRFSVSLASKLVVPTTGPSFLFEQNFVDSSCALRCLRPQLFSPIVQQHSTYRSRETIVLFIGTACFFIEIPT